MTTFSNLHLYWCHDAARQIEARLAKVEQPVAWTHPTSCCWFIKDGRLYAQASAGIVADSVPEMEWRETEAKARAIRHASEMVEQGF